MKKVVFVLWIAVLSIPAKGQEFGGNRFSTRWRQLNTDTARVIFPVGVDSAAQRITRLLHKVASENHLPLGNKLRKINIVLQPQTTVSNGYAGLGPFRSEFYLTPPSDNFDIGTNPWTGQLTLHEYRHIQQYNSFNNGASKVMRTLFGEEGYALAINAAIPNWFFEGDAVFQETMLSPQGRGRLPSFLKAYPALWQAGKKYSWMKLRNGSYKDFVPNHYELGYLLLNFGHEKYGSDFWKNVTSEASAFRGVFYPMQKAVKRHSGLDYTEFTKNAFDHYKKRYEAEAGLRTSNAQKGGDVINYYYPQQISTDSLVFLKSSYTERPAFYIKNSEGERILRVRDIALDNQFSYRNGKIVYSAFESHPRWQWENYSVIKILDIKTNQQKTLQTGTRYFAPDISEDGATVIANKVSINGQSSLVLLNSSNGTVLQEFSSDSITYFANPKFIASRKIVSAIRLKNAKSFIGLIDLDGRTISALTPPSFNTVGHVSTSDNYVLFTASQGLKDEVFMTDIISKQLMKLDNDSGYFNYFPHEAFGKLNYSAFTANGYELQQLNGDWSWRPAYNEDLTLGQAGITPAKKGAEPDFMDHIIERSFSATPYTKLTRPFNFHSWRPNYSDPIFDFTVYGNNVLNTVETHLRYQFNENDRTHAVDAGLVYGGMFPRLNIGSKLTFRRHSVFSDRLKEWNQWDNYAGISIPLNWVSGRTYKFFNWGATYSNRTDFNTGINRDTFRTVRFGYLAHQISWGQQVQQMRQDIFPKWGYNLNAHLSHALNLYKGWQLYSRANIFMPGFFPAHSFYITAAAQESGIRDRIFANRFPFARGFHGVDSARLGGLTFNYHLPIAYPDWGFGNIFYLQRLRGGVFYDYTKVFGKNSPVQRELISTGGELFFDTKWWNQHPITFGFRSGYLLKPDPVTERKKIFFEFILPVSIIPR